MSFTQANKETFANAEKLDLEDKKIIIDYYFGQPEQMTNEKGQPYTRGQPRRAP